VGWKFGHGADGEVDVGGEDGGTGEETRFDVDDVEMDRFEQVVPGVCRAMRLFLRGMQRRLCKFFSCKGRLT